MCIQRDARLLSFKISSLKGCCGSGCVCNYDFSVLAQEFEESGDPEKHFQALLSLAKEGIQKGKVWL